MRNIGILNYGTGNLSSVLRRITDIGELATVVASGTDLSKVDALVLPGVGHFGSAMRNLVDTGLLKNLTSALRDGLPTLGICLGFQLLCEYSEEDLSTRGLGFIPLAVSRLNSVRETNVKIPQIGWNTISRIAGKSLLFEGLTEDELVFYFANSFGVKLNQTTMISTSYFHGNDYFASIESSSIFGVQFHPEKSGMQGLQVLRNFIRLVR